MHEDDYLKFESNFSKHGDEPNVLNFSVTLRRYSASDDEAGPVLARLNGFLVQPGYLPEGGMNSISTYSTCAADMRWKRSMFWRVRGNFWRKP